MNVVRSIFLPVDADKILKIPVCMRDVPDSWAWYPDKKGNFSVSSVYRMIISTKIERERWLEGRMGPSDGLELSLEVASSI